MPPVRRADFFAALAYAMDLATGQSEDFALRSCRLSMRLAEAAGFDTDARRHTFHQALLRYVGCNADTHLMSAFVEDEIAFRHDVAQIDMANPAEMLGVLIRAIRRNPAASGLGSALAVLKGLGNAATVSMPVLSGHCEVARRIGERLALDTATCEGLGQLYARWDGKGIPKGLGGQAITPAVRVVMLAQDAIVLADSFGTPAMLTKIAARRGKTYDPHLTDLFLAQSATLMAGLDGVVDVASILALEPLPHALLDDSALDGAHEVLADIADMRMPQTHGHSRAVADLAVAAGRHLGLPDGDLTALRRAGLAHDIGELALPVGVWLRPGPLTARETDTARLHPYHGERILLTLAQLPEVAALVARHHERLDGSGYHRAARAPDLSPAARVLAAAEAYQTATEPRPHRPALTPAAAANQLRAAIRDGRLCPEAGEAVLVAAGQPSRRAVQGAGLTPREIEVLRALARGQTAKAVARSLGIAPKTADNHIQNLYAKIGVTTRAGAVLYALERGLVEATG